MCKSELIRNLSIFHVQAIKHAPGNILHFSFVKIIDVKKYMVIYYFRFFNLVAECNAGEGSGIPFARD